eukprot:6401567-Prymnesium_polylepis.1
MEEHSSLAKQLEDTHEQRQHAPFVVVATRGAAARAPRRAREEVEDLGAPRAHRLGEAVPLRDAADGAHGFRCVAWVCGVGHVARVCGVGHVAPAL